MTVLEASEIQKIIPHRYPMLLVDRIIELEPMKRSFLATSPATRLCPAF